MPAKLRKIFVTAKLYPCFNGRFRTIVALGQFFASYLGGEKEIQSPFAPQSGYGYGYSLFSCTPPSEKKGNGKILYYIYNKKIFLTVFSVPLLNTSQRVGSRNENCHLSFTHQGGCGKLNCNRNRNHLPRFSAPRIRKYIYGKNNIISSHEKHMLQSQGTTS